MFQSFFSRTFFVFIISILMGMSALASHISGVNISYECLGGEDYLITVNLFRDCQDQNDLPANLNVFIGSTCLNVGYTAFPQVDLIEVSQLCAAELPNSTCSGGLQPGVQMGVYQAVVQLEQCIDWRIIVSEQNRDGAIVNLVDPELFSVHSEAFLDNSSGACNSSPMLSLLNLPSICVGTPLFYNLGFLETDGDSLSYALVNAQTSVTPNIPTDLTYTAPYSGSEPITGMTIDPVTGQISVTPNSIGKFTTVVEVSEYRDGELIGVVQYDFIFLVNGCPIPPPEPDISTFANVSGGGYPLDENTIGICPEDDFCFEIAFTSVDPTINVDLTSNIGLLIPGATETVTGSNPATIQFCGTLPPGFEGGSFIITAIDDACPVYGQNFYTIDFSFRQPIQAFSDTSICLGESVNLSAINDTSYSWYSLSGDLLSPGSEVSCNPCQQTTVSPDTSTTYVVQGMYANSTCANTDTIQVNIPLRIDATVADETCTGDDGIIDIDVLTGSGDYDVIWNDIGEGPLTRTDLVAGTYYVFIFDNEHSCSRIDSFNLIQLSPPIADAGSDFEICGLSANLEAIPSYGIPLWIDAPGISFSNPADENTEVTVTSEGVYDFVWSEDAGIGCYETDTLQVTFYAEPTAQILAEDSVCGLSANLDANIVNGLPQWTASAGILFDDQTIQNPEVTTDGFGLSSIYLQVQNGLCLTGDTVDILFIEQPTTNAGADVEVCGFEVEIAAVDGIGNGVWTLPAELNSVDNLTDLLISITADTYGSFEAIRTLTNQGYCVDADTTNILFTEIPNVDIGDDWEVCDSLTEVSFTLPVGDLSWELSPNLNAIVGVSNPEEISGSYGFHQAILHADNGYGCIDSDTLNLNFVVQPELQSVISDTICGLEYILNAEIAGENHYWLNPTNATISDLNFENSPVTVGSEGNYIFQWVAENGGFCLDTAAVPVTFYDQPVSEAGEDLMICGLSTNLGATASYGTLVWQDQPGLTFSNPLSQTSNLAADWYGSYTISLTETNGICTDTDDVEVEFISTPQILNPQWECTGIDAQFTLTFDVSLGDTSSYEILGLDGELSDFTFQSAPLLSETPVEVIFEDYGYCGGDTLVGTQFCPVLTNAGVMDSDTLRLCGNELVEVLPPTGSVLDGNDTLLYAFHNGSPGALGTVYEWNSEPEFIFSTVLDFNQTYFISAVAGNEMNGGVDLDDPYLSVSGGTPVEFYQLPYGEISGEFDACPYDTVFIPVDLSGAMPQEITYSVNDQTYSVMADSPDFSLAIADSGLVSLLSTNSQYCTGEVVGAAHLSYYRIPEVSMSGPSAVCDGDSALIEIEMDGWAPFNSVVYQNGLPIETINTSEDYLSFNTFTGGEFTIVNLSDANCTLFDTLSTSLTIKPLPDFSAGEDLALCTGDTLLIGEVAQPGQIYSWSANEALLSLNSAQVPFAAESNSPFPQSSQVYLTAELNGCFGIDSATITIHAVPQPQFAGQTVVCSSDTISLVAFGGETYEWSPVQYFSNPYELVTGFSATANTEIELTAISAVGCESTISIDMEILPSPIAAFAVSELSGCAPLDIELDAISGNSLNTYNWLIPGEANLPNTPSQTTTLAEAGEYPISLMVTAPNGCSERESLPDTIRVFSTRAEFTFAPQKPSFNNPEVYFMNQSPHNVSSEWTVDSLLFSESRNATYTFPEYIGGSYNVCLNVTDENDCTAEYCDVVKIKREFDLYVPNAFTPNGDGLNDLFYPVMTNIDVTEYKFWINDSRGRLVFSSTDINAKWDGHTADEDYYGENKIYNWYLIVKPDYNVETTYFTGQVMLVR